MTLQIIGSGFGRTGTMTMKDALGVLGFGPTHHMTEVMAHPEQLAHWQAVFAGRPVDWNAVYAGYASQVDWPGASAWEQALKAFPEAKVIHTERPEAEWWASFDKTIGKFFRHFRAMPLPPEFRQLFRVMSEGFMSQTFDDPSDRDCAIDAYRRNNARVRALVPSERLLVFNVAEGWEPLCRFLGVPVPQQPFPHHHIRREFWEHFGGEPEVA